MIYFLLAALLGFSSQAFAATPAFTNLTQEDVDKIMKEMSANTTLHSVTPPSTMGSIIGIEVGAIAGGTKSPEIDAQAKRVSSGADVRTIPHAGLLGVVSIPFGLTGEVMYLPKLSSSGVEYQQWAAALKWTPALPLPINLAVRGFLAKSELSFKQNLTDALLGEVEVTVKSTNQVSGAQILVSPRFIPIIEPYAGLGYLVGSGSLSYSGNTTSSIFAGAGSSYSSSPTSQQILLGVDLRLLILGLGAEYSRAFNTDTYTVKASLKF